MSTLKKIALVALGAALLAGCNDPYRWSQEPYRANMSGDIWAPRPDWAQGDKNDQQDYKKALEEQKSFHEDDDMPTGDGAAGRPEERGTGGAHDGQNNDVVQTPLPAI